MAIYPQRPARRRPPTLADIRRDPRVQTAQNLFGMTVPGAQSPSIRDVYLAVQDATLNPKPKARVGRPPPFKPVALAPARTTPPEGVGPAGVFGQALERRKSRKTGTASTNPAVLRDRAARLRAQAAARTPTA